MLQTLRIRVYPLDASSDVTFELPAVAGETVGQLKERVSAHACPPAYFALQTGGRSLKLVEPVASLLADDGGTFDVVSSRCSHGAPIHPVTGECPCFYDGVQFPFVEY